MPEKTNDKEAKGAAKPSPLKDEILQRINEQEARERESGTRSGLRPVAPAPAEKKPWFVRKPNLYAMTIFCRQLATLIDVGIPLLKSLQVLGERSSQKKLKLVSQDLARRVEEGQSLSAAMDAHPNVFTPQFAGVVRQGEAGGILEDSLKRLADLLERRAELRRRVVSALMYPAFALAVEIVVLCTVLFYALPRLMSAFPEQDKLPEATKIIMRIAEFANNYWAWVIVGVVVIIVGSWLFLRTAAGRLTVQWTTLRTPIVGGLARSINVARFARTLGSLLSAGIPLIAALKISADTSDNPIVEKVLLGVRDTVEHGGKMDEGLRKDKIFEPVMVDMVMVGDEAGALDVMLLKIADSYEARVDSQLRALTSILEPLLIVFMGLAVAFVALAVFVPYFQLVNSPVIAGDQ